MLRQGFFAFLCLQFLTAVLAQRDFTVTPRFGDLPRTLSEADTYLQILGNENLYSGQAYATKGGKTVFSKGYGDAIPEFNVKMKPGFKYNIGSNTKLFTAVAIWQLHVRGKLNINDTVDKYMDAKDFNLTSTWCPRLINVTTGPCQYPKLYHLLSMQSGFIDVDNCDYEPQASQTQYCWAGPKGAPNTYDQTNFIGEGAADPAALIRLWGILQLPMQSKPGTEYAYVNANFILAGYVLEKVSGMNTVAYWKQYIWNPIGMKDTFMDLSGGNDGLYKGALISPYTLSNPFYSYDNIGNLTQQVGQIQANGDLNAVPYGRFVKMTKSGMGPFVGFANGYGHTAGGIFSTNKDMGNWFRTLTRKPKVLGLTTEVVKHMFTTGIIKSSSPLLTLTFAQGIVVQVNNSLPLGTKYLFYDGNIGYDAVHYSYLHPTNASEDVHTAVISYTQPNTGLLEFGWMPNNGTKNSSIPYSSPLATTNRTHTCYLEIIPDDPVLYLPRYGCAGGLAVRSKKAWAAFLSAATKRGDAAASGNPAPAPQFCTVRPWTALRFFFSTFSQAV